MMIAKKVFFSCLLTTCLLLGACKQVHSPAEPGDLVPKTVDQDSALPGLDRNGTRLHTETFGLPTDPLLVILHGGPGGDYRSMLAARAFAADGFHVVFYDQRGTGLSKREVFFDLAIARQF